MSHISLGRKGLETKSSMCLEALETAEAWAEDTEIPGEESDILTYRKVVD